MTPSRRDFLRRASLAAACAAAPAPALSAQGADPPSVTQAQLDKILDEPVLKTDFLKGPVIVSSIELLRNGKSYLVRVRSADGAEAVTIPNASRMADTYPLFLNQVVPVFLKQDARSLETLLWDVYRYNSN